MSTVTKKELIDRLAEREGAKRTLVKRVVHGLLNEIVEELAKNNRLEFRDFGVFECKVRAARLAQNPKTMDKVPVPPKRAVKFKMGRIMRLRLSENPCGMDEATGLPLEAAAPKTLQAAGAGQRTKSRRR